MWAWVIKYDSNSSIFSFHFNTIKFSKYEKQDKLDLIDYFFV